MDVLPLPVFRYAEADRATFRLRSVALTCIKNNPYRRLHYTNITQLMKLNGFYKNCIILITEANVTKTNGYNKLDEKHACLGGEWSQVRILSPRLS